MKNLPLSDQEATFLSAELGSIMRAYGETLKVMSFIDRLQDSLRVNTIEDRMELLQSLIERLSLAR